MTDCLDCNRWQDCEGHTYEVKTDAGTQYVSWYSYAEIRFCPHQIIWIVRNRETLLGGRWVADPVSSSYTDGNIQTGYQSEAGFVKPEIIIGEVEKRMKSLTRDARDAFMDAVDKEYEIENYSPTAKRVLMYLKGHKRKIVTFARWKSLKNSYKNVSK